MSVPLDRLYHYLDDCVNHDLLIYRWMPHGSRKLEDLTCLNEYSVKQLLRNPLVICHDQEPLHFDFYPKDYIKAIAEKNASNGASYAKENYKHFYLLADYIGEQHLRGATVYDNNFDFTLLLHSEQNSLELEKFCRADFFPVYYWSHAIISCDWFRYAKVDPKLKFDMMPYQKDFLVYNRSWSGTREYRLTFAESMVQNDLVKFCKTSFAEYDNNIHYTNHQYKNPDFITTNKNLEKFYLPNQYSAKASADYDSQDYMSTGIEIVLETLFDDCRWHLTEKTLRPIACNKPFILMATAGSLKYLKNYGFQTFNELIDESYDDILDSKKRLNAVINEMKRISNFNQNDKKVLFSQLNKITKKNQEWFFNDFQNIVIDEYKKNMEEGIKFIKSNCTNKHNKKIQHLLKSALTA